MYHTGSCLFKFRTVLMNCTLFEMADIIRVAYQVSMVLYLSAVLIEGQLSVAVDVNITPARRGSQVILRCNYTRSSNLPLDGIGWSHGEDYKGSQSIALYSSRRGEIHYNYGQPGDYVMTEPDPEPLLGTSTLTIFSVQPRDGGSYWCHINAIGFIEQDFVVLEIETKSEYYTPEDRSVTMSCVLPNIDDSILVQYYWSKVITEDNSSIIASWDIEGLTPINADEFPFPDYQMTIDEATLSSNMTLASATLHDDGTYLCATSFVPTPNGGNPKDEFRLVVSGSSGITTALTTLSSVYERTNSRITSGSIETVPLTTEMTNFLSIIRVESMVIELSWRLFQEINDDIDQYRIFYSEVDESNSIGLLLEMEADKNRVNITKLSPGVTYTVRVEALTNLGELIIVGTLNVKTLDTDETASVNLFTIVGISVTTFLAAIVIILLIFILKRRYPSVHKKTNTEYAEATPVDDGEYQELQLVTSQKDKPLVNEIQLLSLPPLPSNLNSLSEGINGSESEQTTGYIEIYGPNSHGSSNRQYQELDPTTMASQSTAVYPTPEPGSEYQELSKSGVEITKSTTDISNPDPTEQETDHEPPSSFEGTEYEVSETMPDYLEVINTDYTELQTVPPSIYQELNQNAKNEATASIYVVPEILAVETPELPITDLHEVPIGNDSSEDGYHELDQKTIDKPHLYQSLSKSD